MKRLLACLMLLLSLLALTGCRKKPEPGAMTIAPAVFSQETQDVLRVLDQEIAFYDYTIDETIKSYAVALWLCENGTWTSAGMSYGNVQPGKARIAVRVTDGGVDLFSIEESGYVKSSYPAMAQGDSGMAWASTRLNNPTAIRDGEEIPLWVRLGKREDATGSTSITVYESDFRRGDCDAGVAVTITFSSKAVE